MEFPEKVFTLQEVEAALKFIGEGYRHNLTVSGSPQFEENAKKALKLIETAEYHDFLRTYIRKIVEINGLSQLREEDAAIWANNHAVADPIDAATFFIQKAQQMKDYLEGEPYVGGAAEATADKKGIEFLKVLKNKSEDNATKKRCEKALQLWEDSKFL